METDRTYEAVVIGVSSGGIKALRTLLPALPADFPLPVLIVQHISANSDSEWITILDSQCSLTLKEADEKERIADGYVYFAPPNYHMLIECDRTISLSVDERVNYARPSIDVLFESASWVYGSKLIGIILTGANHDGAKGLKKIKENGGLTIAQDPSSADAPFMPLSAIKECTPDHIADIRDIPHLLKRFTLKPNSAL